MLQSVLGQAAPGVPACEVAKTPVIPIAASMAAPVANRSFCLVVIKSSSAATLAVLKGVVAGGDSVTFIPGGR